MSEVAKNLIKKYLERNEGPDSDEVVREVAAARLWQTGDKENQQAAEKIWKEVGTNEGDVDELKKDYFPKKKSPQLPQKP